MTTTLTGDLRAWARAVVSAAGEGVVEELERLAEGVAAAARPEWYGPRGVERETGLSGDIQVVTTIDPAASRVVVAVGSTDTRRNGGKPVPVFVRSPGISSVDLVPVTVEAYWRTPPSLRGPFSRGRVASWTPTQLAQLSGDGPWVRRQREGAGQGHGMLLSALVMRPMKKAVETNITSLAVSIARRGGRARG